MKQKPDRITMAEWRARQGLAPSPLPVEIAERLCCVECEKFVEYCRCDAKG